MFKKYQRTGRGRIDLPSISISAMGFRLNQSCISKYFEGKSHVELFFDEEKNIVGFLPLSEASQDSFPLKIYRPDSSPSGVIHAKVFIKETRILDIMKEVDRSSFLVREGEEGMLLISLV